MINFNKIEIQIRFLGIFLCSIFFLASIGSLMYSTKSLGGSGYLDFLNNSFHVFGLSNHISIAILVVCIYIGFLYLLCLITKEERLYSPDKKSVFMLIALSLLGFSTCAQISYVIDAFAGYILPVKKAPIWIFSVLCVELSIYAFTPDTPMEKLLISFHDFGPQTYQKIYLILIFWGIHCFTYFLGVFIAREVKQRHALDKAHAELKATQKLYENNVRIQERIYISRELHDTIGHSLTAISTNLQLAERLCNNEAQEPIHDAYKVSKLLLSDVREIVNSLRKEEDMNLQEALVTLISAIKYPKITFYMPDSLKIKNPSISHVLFRCVQEIITNTMKHANAQNLKISIEKLNNTITLASEDDGIGVKTIKYSNGLTGMAERIKELNGEIIIASEPNKGFRINITIPIIEADYD